MIHFTKLSRTVFLATAFFMGMIIAQPIMAQSDKAAKDEVVVKSVENAKYSKKVESAQVKEVSDAKAHKCEPGCQKACCANKDAKATTEKAHACKPGCQKACCANKDGKATTEKVHKCEPGCQKACCANKTEKAHDHKEHKHHDHKGHDHH